MAHAIKLTLKKVHSSQLFCSAETPIHSHSAPCRSRVGRRGQADRHARCHPGGGCLLATARGCRISTRRSASKTLCVSIAVAAPYFDTCCAVTCVAGSLLCLYHSGKIRPTLTAFCKTRGGCGARVPLCVNISVILYSAEMTTCIWKLTVLTVGHLAVSDRTWILFVLCGRLLFVILVATPWLLWERDKPRAAAEWHPYRPYVHTTQIMQSTTNV